MTYYSTWREKNHPWYFPLPILVAGIAGLWLLSRPYAGIWHDGLLYAGQALKILFPREFAADLFFLYGSQSDYSLFPQLYAWLVSMLGLAQAHKLGVVAAAVGFVWSAHFLFRKILEPRLLWAGLAALAVFDHFYGPHRIFSFSELFFTARSIAEPLLVLALALLYRGKTATALTLIVLTGCLHPLLAIPAIIVCWFWLSFSDPRWYWAAVLGSIPPALGLIQVEPFTALFQSYDDQWRSLIGSPFFESWAPRDAYLFAYDLFIVSTAAHLCSGNVRKLCISILATVFLCLAVTLIGADLLNNVLLTQLQFWRAGWLLRFFSLMLTPLVIASIYRSNSLGRYSALLIFVSACTLDYLASLVALILGILLWRTGNRISSLRVAKKVEYTLFFTFFVAWTIIVSMNVFKTMTVQGDFAILLRNLFFSITFSVTVACAFLFLVDRKKWAAAVPFAASLLILGVLKWDVSSPLRMAFDHGMEQRPLAIRDHIAPTQQVYWEGGDIFGPWLLLQRPAYFADAQRSGLLFNRKTAIEFAARQKNIAALAEQENACWQAGATQCNYDIAALRDACTRAEQLDFLVFKQKISDLAEATWKTSGYDGNPVTFYLYRCRRLLEAS